MNKSDNKAQQQQEHNSKEKAGSILDSGLKTPRAEGDQAGHFIIIKLVIDISRLLFSYTESEFFKHH